MHPVLAGFLMAWRERTPYAKDDDYVFPSFRLKGKKPLSASIMVQKYLRPAAVKAGVIKEDERVRFGFHNFRHSLASSLVARDGVRWGRKAAKGGTMRETPDTNSTLALALVWTSLRSFVVGQSIRQES